jgi:hypothetical protein
MAKTHKPIFSIQDEPPVWPDDSDDLDIESVSEPELEAEQTSIRALWKIQVIPFLIHLMRRRRNMRSLKRKTTMR